MHHLKEHISETAYICKVIGHSFIPPEQQICDSPPEHPLTSDPSQDGGHWGHLQRPLECTSDMEMATTSLC